MKNFKRYQTYKNSGVEWLGKVPDSWVASPLWAVSTVNNDERIPFENESEEFEYVDISTVTLESGVGTPTVLLAKDAPSRAQRKAKSGDIVVSTVRTYLRAIGKVSKELENAIFSTGFAIVRASKISPGFLYYSLLTEHFLFCVEANSTGVSYPAINSSDLMKLKILVPSIDEQEIIARYLDSEISRIDSLVSEKERFIELLREKRQAMITHLVTKGLDSGAPMKDSCAEWLGQVPAHWDVSRVKYAIRSIGQGWSPECESRPAEDGEWGVLKVGCVNGGIFRSIENKALPTTLTPRRDLALKKGDVLVSRANTRELVGGCALIEQDFPQLMICDKLYRLIVDVNKAIPAFLAALISVHGRREVELEATGASASMVNIAQSVICNLQIALPPLEEQFDIISTVAAGTQRYDTLISTSERSIELLKERRSALITAAVTGQIDLREAA